MSKDINLSPRKREDVLIRQKKLRSIRIGSLTFFAVAVFLTVSVVSLNIFSPVGSLKKEQETLLDNLSSYGKKIGKYSFVSSRIRDVSEIFDRRSKYNEIIQQLSRNLPPDAQIETMKISQKKVGVSIVSSSLTSIGTFIDSVVLLASNSDVFQRVTLESLTSDTLKGQHNASIVLDTI